MYQQRNVRKKIDINNLYKVNTGEKYDYYKRKFTSRSFRNP
jgi:hypothetical protein